MLCCLCLHGWLFHQVPFQGSVLNGGRLCQWRMLQVICAHWYQTGLFYLSLSFQHYFSLSLLFVFSSAVFYEPFPHLTYFGLFWRITVLRIFNVSFKRIIWSFSIIFFIIIFVFAIIFLVYSSILVSVLLLFRFETI